MQPFTVVTYFTPKFACFSQGLREDCRTLGYELHSDGIADEFPNLIQAFDYKISYIQRMVRRYGTVLWLDVECRIVRPIPELWSSPLISIYETGESRGFSSGVLMLDDSHLELLDLWSKYARKYPRYPDDFVLDFLAHSVGLNFATVPLEFYDRETQAPIARGLWRNKHTIIQHPTINRWPEPTKYRRVFNGDKPSRRSESESIARQRKGIFYRNFGGDFSQIEAVMRAGVESEYHDSEWIFDAVNQLYAPEPYWPDFAGDFTAKPRSLEKSRKNFNTPPKGETFRAAAIRKMRLDAGDATQYGHSPSCEEFIGRIRSFFKGRR